MNRKFPITTQTQKMPLEPREQHVVPLGGSSLPIPPHAHPISSHFLSNTLPRSPAPQPCVTVVVAAGLFLSIQVPLTYVCVQYVSLSSCVRYVCVCV